MEEVKEIVKPDGEEEILSDDPNEIKDKTINIKPIHGHFIQHNKYQEVILNETVSKVKDVFGFTGIID